jgi:regulator of replication initiation timing
MKDQIFNICDTLQKAGINPTAEKVRVELGGGSFSTISPIVKEWRASQTKAQTTPEIPAEAQNAAIQATAIIWKIATDHQAEAINAIRQESQRIEQEAIIERDEAMKEIAILESEAKTLHARIEALEAQNQATTAEKQALEIELQRQRLTLDSVILSNEEQKAEIRERHKKAPSARDGLIRFPHWLGLHRSTNGINSRSINAVRLLPTGVVGAVFLGFSPCRLFANAP